MSQLTDNLNTIASIKEDIRDAIESKGVNMSGVSFASFADKIGEIQTGGGQPVTTALSVSSNGTYTPPQGVDGFDTVTVSVPQQTVVGTNVIYYTSSNNSSITPIYDSGETDITEFGANIISNVYNGNQGVITFDGPVTKLGGQWSEGGIGRLTSITIPISVTEIKGNSLGTNPNLKTVHIPPLVTKIGSSYTRGWAFANNSGLMTVEIPPSVTEIYTEAFAYCGNLEYVKLPPFLNEIGDYLFQYCTSLKNITIPDGYTYIGAGMFAWSGLTSIYIPASVTSIGSGAFRGCANAAVVRVNSNNSDYDSRNNCNAIIETATDTLMYGFGLTVIPSTVTTIDSFAFADITTLTSITIPSSIGDIGYRAFYGCTNLAEVIVNNPVPYQIDNDVFEDTSENLVIKVPASAVMDYKMTIGWSTYASKIVAQ